MRRAVLIAFVGVASLCSPMLFAQGATQRPQTPQTAPNAPPPKSTALILGQVVDGTSGQPIAEAIVTLSRGGRGGGGPMDLGALAGNPQAQQALAAFGALGGGRGPGGPQRVMTGADGRFVFHDLPPGQFQLTASLTGYTASLNVSISSGGLAALMSAAINPSGAPTTLAVKEGEFATGVKMRLWKNAVVSGTVLDDAGEPAIGLSVQVARRVMVAGRARYVPGSTAKTDDRGAYRLSGLVPGDYLVVVPQTQVSIPTAILSGLIESLTSGGGLGGGMMGLMDVMTSGINPTDAMAGGVRIGDFMVASSGSVPLMTPEGRLQAYQTLFYPGAAAPAQATVVSLKSGEDRNNINFQLSLTVTSRVTGVAMGPDGPVANLGVRLVVPGDGMVSESEFDVATAVTKTDGTFAFYGVPPGQFLLRANKQARPEMPAELMAQPAMQALFGGAGGAKATEMLFAAANLNVAGGDVDGVLLQLAPGFKVSGRVEFESATGRPLPNTEQMRNVTVALTPMDGRSVGGLLGDMSQPDRPNDKAEFKTKGYAPGKYFLTVSVAGPGGWQAKSASIGGRDVLDAPLEIKEADVAGVVVGFTDKLGSVAGTVRAANETDLSETTVLLFPANYRAWIDTGMNPRRVRTTRASRAGAYTVANLPAGDYLAAAIDRANEGDMQDPAFIDALSRVATKVTVAADPATLDLMKTRVVR